MKCHVVEDLKKHFNTHGIAGEKLRKKLFDVEPHTASHEPTDDEDAEEKPKKKKRKKYKKTEISEKTVPPKAEKKLPPSVKAAPPDKAGLPSPPRPLCQGIWTKTQSYRGWHPEHWYGGPPGVLRDCYQDRRSGQAQGERPDSWDSEGPFHSEDSASAIYESSDEYNDEYTIISHIRQNLDTNICSIHANDVPVNQAMTAHPPPFLTVKEARDALTANAATVANSSPASPNTIVKMMTQNCKKAGMNTAETIHALQCAGINTNQEGINANLEGINTNQKTGTVKQAMISQGKPFTKDDLRTVSTLRREGKDVPLSLKHVPSLHGPKWCHAVCIRRKVVPYKCGFHESWGSVNACSPLCNGGYCDHYDDPDNYAEPEDGIS